MTALQKINIGTQPDGKDGDTNRVASVRHNANIDVLSTQAVLQSMAVPLTASAELDVTALGRRITIALDAPGDLTLPPAGNCPPDSVIALRNTGSHIAGLVPAGSNTTALASLAPGESVLLDTNGVSAWRVVMRGRGASPDEMRDGKFSAVNAPNLAYNGSGELANSGWATSNLAAGAGAAGEGTLFQNAAAITAGAALVDLSNRVVACGPGVALSLQAELWSAGMTAGAVTVKVEALAENLAVLGEVAVISLQAGAAGWRWLASTGTTPAGTALVRIQKAAVGDPRASTTGCRIRRIKLERGATPSLYSHEPSLEGLAKDARPLLDAVTVSAASVVDFLVSPQVPTLAAGDSSQKAVNAAYLKSELDARKQGLTLIRSIAATGGPATVFNDLPVFDVYELVFVGLVPNTISDLGIHLSITNGASWITTNSYQVNGDYHTHSGGSPTGGRFSTIDVGEWRLWTTMSNVGGSPNWASYSGKVTFFNFRDVNKLKQIIYQVSGAAGNVLGGLIGEGRLGAGQPTAINALRIFGGASGFSSGKMTLYGYNN